MNDIMPLGLFFLAAIAVVVTGVRVVPEARRLAVFRLGRYAGLRGPGLVITIPVVDRAMSIDLDTLLPAWRSLPPERLEAEVGRRLVER